MEIRHATHADAKQISALVGELGYTATPELIRDKLACIQESSADAVFVAVADDRVSGCISLHALPMFHREGKLGRITSLVVADDQQGLGMGSALLASSHVWLEDAGCVKFEVTSGDRRERAHRFYKQHGYSREGLRFARKAIKQ